MGLVIYRLVVDVLRGFGDMKKILLLLILSLGFIGNSYATVMICTDNNDPSTCTLPSPPSDMADSWYCNEGFIKNSDETRCIKIGEDENAGQPFTKWYENGQKESEIHFKYDKWHGKWTYWYENGQKMFETNFIDNKYDGKSTEWYENGQIEREGFHENGKAIGWWRFWLEDGQIDYVKNYNIVTN